MTITDEQRAAMQAYVEAFAEHKTAQRRLDQAADKRDRAYLQCHAAAQEIGRPLFAGHKMEISFGSHDIVITKSGTNSVHWVTILRPEPLTESDWIEIYNDAMEAEADDDGVNAIATVESKLRERGLIR